MGWGECFVCRGSGRADPERRQCNSITAGGRCLAPVDTANPAQLQGGSRPACCGEGMRGIIPLQPSSRGTPGWICHRINNLHIRKSDEHGRPAALAPDAYHLHPARTSTHLLCVAGSNLPPCSRWTFQKLLAFLLIQQRVNNEGKLGPECETPRFIG